MTTLTRSPVGTAASGLLVVLPPLLGAGMFWALAPAVAAAGWGALAGLLIAAVVAALAIASADASAGDSVTADWLFLGGRVAATGAVALIAGDYLWAPFGRPIALVLVIAATLFSLRGRTLPRAVRAVSVVLIVAALITAGVLGLVSPPALETVAAPAQAPLAVLAAAASTAFVFAGPAPVGPRRSAPALVITTVIAAFLTVALLLVLGSTGATLPSGDAPLLALVAGSPADPALRLAALLAASGSLLASTSGIRALLQRKAEGGELPGSFAVISPRTGSPATAQLAIGLASVLATMILDIEVLAAFAVGALLAGAALTHWRVLRGAVLPRWIPILGLIGCAAVIAGLPWPAITSTAAYFAIILIMRSLRGL